LREDPLATRLALLILDSEWRVRLPPRVEPQYIYDRDQVFYTTSLQGPEVHLPRPVVVPPAWIPPGATVWRVGPVAVAGYDLLPLGWTSKHREVSATERRDGIQMLAGPDWVVWLDFPGSPAPRRIVTVGRGDASVVEER
jgi:hypothetical protein